MSYIVRVAIRFGIQWYWNFWHGMLISDFIAEYLSIIFFRTPCMLNNLSSSTTKQNFKSLSQFLTRNGCNNCGMVWRKNVISHFLFYICIIPKLNTSLKSWDKTQSETGVLFKILNFKIWLFDLFYLTLRSNGKIAIWLQHFLMHYYHWNVHISP